MIGVMLGSRFPMMLGWGPDLLAVLQRRLRPRAGRQAPRLARRSGAGRLVGDLERRRPADAQRSVGWPGALARARAPLHQQPRLRAGDFPHVLAEPRARRRRQGRRRPAHGPGDDRTSSGRAPAQTLRALAERTGVAKTATEACASAPRSSKAPTRTFPSPSCTSSETTARPTLAASSPASLSGRADLRAAADEVAVPRGAALR